MAANPFERVLRALQGNDIRYVVAGGFAAVMHGYGRFTADLDIFVDLDPDHARRAVQTLLDLGMKPRLPVDPFLFADAATRDEWSKTRGMQVFTFIDPGLPTFAVDLFTDAPGRFDRFFARAETFRFHGLAVTVCPLDELISMKRAAGRPQDLADIQALEAIRAAKGRP